MKEQHAVDWSAFVEGERGQWRVTFDHRRVPGSFRTREAARRAVREMKRSKGRGP